MVPVKEAILSLQQQLLFPDIVEGVDGTEDVGGQSSRERTPTSSRRSSRHRSYSASKIRVRKEGVVETTSEDFVQSLMREAQYDFSPWDQNYQKIRPNLHHLIKITKSLGRNKRLLSLNPVQIGSFFCCEAMRIYCRVLADDKTLHCKANSIARRCFGEGEEETMVWWPGYTEKGLEILNGNNYNHFLKNVQVSYKI